ncbi:MAG: DNA polymerase III subunit beta [Actinomycetota bacterium]
MKIETTKSNLLDAVLFASRIISSKPTNYILNGIMLEADNKLTIYSTDLETNIKTEIGVSIKQKGKVVVPSKIFLNILKNFPESKIELELNQDKNQLKITCQKAVFTLNLFPLEEFPQFPEIKKDNIFKIDMDKFKKLIHKTQKSISTDEGRVILTGVLCKIKKDKIVMVSTDSYRLSCIEEEIKFDNGEQSVIIPGKTLDNILKIESGKKPLEINIEPNQVSFGVEDNDGRRTNITSRLLSGKFPEYDKLIPKNIKHNIMINKEKLLEVVRRISSISQENLPVKVVIGSGKINVSMDIKEVGSSSEEFEVPYGEEEIDIAFNPQFLVDGINTIEGKNVLFGVEETLKPVLLKPEKEGSFFYLLMPIRIS